MKSPKAHAPGTVKPGICSSSYCNAGGLHILSDASERQAEADLFLDRWGLVPDGETVITQSSLLVPVRRGDTALMLKIADAADDEAHGALVLRAYAGRGAVRLVEAMGHVMLMERLDPAESLEAMVLAGQDDAATGIICDVVAQLHETNGDWPELIPIPRRTDDLRRHLAHGRVKPVDLPLMQTAAALADTLAEETWSNWHLLHGDIHHFNILQSHERGWLAIDPKGIRGPRVYDYANALCNPYMHASIVGDPARMNRQAAIMAERAGFDRTDLLRWTFVHGAQCAAWSLFQDDQGYWLACAQTAAHLAKVAVLT